jgi:hypothetical protein
MCPENLLPKVLRIAIALALAKTGMMPLSDVVRADAPLPGAKPMSFPGHSSIGRMLWTEGPLSVTDEDISGVRGDGHLRK